jgi:hypothetical protein
VWPAGVFVASLGIVRHLSFRERRKKFSIVPATGLHSESNSSPKGTFKARTSKGIFSQFHVFRIWLRKKLAEIGVQFRAEGHTVARRCSAYQKALSFRTGPKAR